MKKKITIHLDTRIYSELISFKYDGNGRKEISPLINEVLQLWLDTRDRVEEKRIKLLNEKQEIECKLALIERGISHDTGRQS